VDTQPQQTSGRGTNTTGDEFNFGNYDQEEDARLRLGDIAIVDPTENTEDVPDSEDEDDVIQKSDNLILVGRVEDNAATLEVYGKCTRT
jgi:periodic tryptophan protein 1